jgi:hypothetical protein
VSNVFSNANEVLHRIKVKLYLNYLPDVSGAYIARTNNEAILSIEEICAAAKNRSGFIGSYQDMVRTVKSFFDEAAYQLADGYAVNTGWFSLYPKIGGTFAKASEGIDPRKNKVTFAFRSLDRLRELAEKIAVEIEGVANNTGYVDEILDVCTGRVNEVLTPGGMLAISGNKIKIAGDHQDVDLWFYKDIPNFKPVKVTENLGANGPNKIIAAIPGLKKGPSWRIRIVTQYTSGPVRLKTPRVLEYPIELTVA